MEEVKPTENKSERSATGIIIFFLVVLVLFTGFIFFRESSKINEIVFDYGKFKVQKVNSNGIEAYRTEIFINENQEPNYITLRHNPRNLENISVEISDLKSKLLKDELFISMEPNATGKSVIAGTEISKIIGNPFLFNIPSHGALLRDIGNNAPVMTCSDANSNKSVAVIEFRAGEENKIYSDGECVIAEAITEDDLIRVADRISYTALGIMS
ncbi:MAG: hypothetical protein Q8Q30_01940 [Candidatus Woesebacteria bacterium]|nr:hypothetical protein [Candidatus Woesebacteria bacterium]